MTEAKHTPGPMSAEYKAGFTMEGNTIVVMNPDRYPFAFVPAWDDPREGEENGEDEARANARLIAAAPEMLETLIAAEKHLRPLSGRSRNAGLHGVVVAAITKATAQ